RLAAPPAELQIDTDQLAQHRRVKRVLRVGQEVAQFDRPPLGPGPLERQDVLVHSQTRRSGGAGTHDCLGHGTQGRSTARLRCGGSSASSLPRDCTEAGTSAVSRGSRTDAACPPGRGMKKSGPRGGSRRGPEDSTSSNSYDRKISTGVNFAPSTSWLET